MNLKLTEIFLTSVTILILGSWCFLFASGAQSIILGFKEYSNKLAIIDFIIQSITISITVKVYLASNTEHGKSQSLDLLFFIIINMWLFIVNYLYYFAVFVQDTYLQSLSSLNFTLYYIPCIVYAILSIIFLGKILLKKFLVSKLAPQRLLILLAINLAIFYLYLSSIHYAYPILSFGNILQIILLFTEFILFDICLIGMIYSTNINAFLMLSGFIILVTGDFFLTYTYITQSITKYFIIGEFLWCLGLIFLLFTAISINNNKLYLISKWFRNDKAIKSRLAFNVYLISIISYLLIYFIGYLLGIIDRQFLILFPVLTMVFSIITVVLSIIIGDKFEEPFQVLKSNIQNCSIDKFENNINYQFDIEEFEYLQSFLLQTIRLKDQNNQLYIDFGNISADAAHELASPMASVISFVNNFKNNKFSSEEVLALEKSVSRIDYITNNLLVKYRKIKPPIEGTDFLLNPEHGEEPRYINIVQLIKEVISLKNIEYELNPCKINCKFNAEYPIFFLSPYKIKQIISNLLNNAYDSLDSEMRNITIELRHNSEYVAISIIDTGIGIPAENIVPVLNGKSFKHDGKGLGLSGANKYVLSLGGKIFINPNYPKGTNVTIKIPNKPLPIWLPRIISYSLDQEFVVIDDDPTIHTMLQNKFLYHGQKGYHFINVDEYLGFVNSYSDLSNLIFLIDLNLNNANWDGFKLVNNLVEAIKANIYLITANAETLQVQNFIQTHGINLIGKDYLPEIQLMLTA